MTIIELFAFASSCCSKGQRPLANLIQGKTHVVINDVSVLHGLILVLAAEALLLDTGDVEHVRLTNDAVEVGGLVEGRASSEELALHVVGHRQRGRRDKVEGDRVQRKKLDERVNGSAIFEIANKSDSETVDRSQF